MSTWTSAEQPLGYPLPDSAHAVSVSLPQWQDIHDYEQGKPRVLQAMRAGYPRFFLNPLVSKLFGVAAQRHAQPGECCFVFPNSDAAQRCLAYIEREANVRARAVPYSFGSLTVVCLPEALRPTVMSYWCHTGEIVSSRLAQAALDDRAPTAGGAHAKDVIRRRLADLYGCDAQGLSLYPSGMAAIYVAQQLASRLFPGERTIQLGFAYVDTLRIQQRFGAGFLFLAQGNREDLARLENALRTEHFAGIICEVPSNPLLRTVDLSRLHELAARYDVPLILDDTSVTPHNVDLIPYADLITSSLTKFFSGTGDVIAGSLVINPRSKWRQSLQENLAHLYRDALYDDDAIILEKNSRDFAKRMRAVNATTEALCDELRTHPRIAEIYYPKLTDGDCYAQCQRAGAGFGGLFSILLRNAEQTTPHFYDRVRIAKGPSFGTNFSILCPYILLAHYQELGTIEQFGISRYLIRVSVGLEDPREISQRISEALNSV